MEEHVILRVSEELQSSFTDEIETNGFPNCIFKFIDDNKIELEYKNKTYRASLIDLPTFIETHKSLDGNQLYKINNVSRMIVVWPSDFNQKQIDHHVKIYTNSGITPPLKYVKLRRWQKTIRRSSREQNVKEIVAELLRKDALASSVDIQQFNMDKNDDEISSIAAELEKDLELFEEVEDIAEKKIEEETEEIKQIKREMQQIQIKIEEKRQFLINSKNPIVRKRFEDNIKNLEAEYDELNKKIPTQV